MTEFRSAVVDVAERVRDASDGLDSRRAVQLRAVEPLLEALGWDVRSTAVEPDAEVGGRSVDYLLQVDGTPAVAVLTDAPGARVDEEHGPTLAAVLREAGLPLGLATDGDELLLVAHAGGDLRHETVDLASLADTPDPLAPFARDAVARRVDPDEALEAARRRLAERRDDAVDAVAASLVDVAGDAIEEPAREAAVRLVTALASPVRPDTGDASAGADASPDAAGASQDAADPSQGDDAPVADGSTASGDGPDAAATSGENAATTDGATPDEDAATDEDALAAANDAPDDRSTGGSPAADERAARTDDDATGGAELATDDAGEYVARFFGGRSSVGAVGTDSPGATLAAAVEYLAENHDLGQSVTLPWGVVDGRATLAAAPEHPDGAAMEPHRAVGDCYVWTGVGPERARAAVEELAEAVGLRVMFQGDW